MAFSIDWTPKYSVHNAKIDEEHKKLFSLVNDLLSLENPQQNMQRFKADVKGLFRYMEYHFRHEEELMEKIHFPDRDAHAKQHDKIISIMNGLLHNCVTLAELAWRLRDFTSQWLLKHVAEEDTKLTNSIDRFAMVTVEG
jgi:hemerythrin